MALLLLLQHGSIMTQLPFACKLHCCSKAVAAAVAEHSAGQLDMPRLEEPTEADQAASWLRKHARLVRSLDLPFTAAAQDAFVAAVLAAGPQSLALQSLSGRADAALPLLEQLPASHLTHLALRQRQQQDQPALKACVSSALGRLTALRHLQLTWWVDDAHAAPLAALTQLTTLSFEGPLPDLPHVPPQLLELQLSSYAEQEQQPLDLRHLAAATALSIQHVPVNEGDVLPPNLLRLQVNHCKSIQPLLPLVQLQQLQLGLEEAADITYDQLQQLSRLTALALGCARSIEPASAGAWPTLPLQRLELRGGLLSAPVCQSLAQLSGLTSLGLREFWLPRAGFPRHQLAAALRQLSGLQQLELRAPNFFSDDWLNHGPQWGADANAIQQQNEETAAGVQQLLHAVGDLQQLRELDISCFPALARAAAAVGHSSSLAALAAVTSLSLENCELTDAAVTSIVSQLPGLQSLNSSWNSGLTDGALPAIGRLQQLTELSLQGTVLADAGLQHLARLTRLEKLDARCTSVTDAGMCHLTGLARLQELCVPRAVTAEQRRRLMQQMHGLHVEEY